MLSKWFYDTFTEAAAQQPVVYMLIQHLLDMVHQMSQGQA
jgi:hypothetical protein